MNDLAQIGALLGGMKESNNDLVHQIRGLHQPRLQEEVTQYADSFLNKFEFKP